MALIEREAAKAKVAEKILGASEFAEDMRQICYDAIDAAPTIDPIKAGRCRCGECKHYAPGTEMPCASMDGLVEPDEDDFCSYGEPREAQDDG